MSGLTVNLGGGTWSLGLTVSAAGLLRGVELTDGLEWAPPPEVRAAIVFADGELRAGRRPAALARTLDRHALTAALAEALADVERREVLLAGRRRRT